MKKILLLLLLLITIIFLFPKSFISYPGYTTMEYYQEFERTKKHCIGFSYLKNTQDFVADDEEESLCFGWLK